MDSQSSETEMGGVRNLFKIGLVIVVFLVITAVLFGVWYSIGREDGDVTETDTEDVRSQPEGVLVMATAAWSPDKKGVNITPTIYEFAQQRLSYMTVDPFPDTPGTDDLSYQHIFSGNGEYVTFAGAKETGKSLSGDVESFGLIPTQIYLARVSPTMNPDEVVSRLQQARPVADNPELFRQFPSVSDRGHVLYMAHSPGELEILLNSNASEWDIYLVQNGQDRFVTAGTRPRWVDDERFVFLKDDGLYIYSLSDESERIVLSLTDIKAKASMALDISDDGQLLAWSIPEWSTVTVFGVHDWSGENVEIIRVFNDIIAISNVFSPDSHFLALESWFREGDVDVLQVEFFDLKDSDMSLHTETLFIENANPDLTQLTDWRP